MLHQYILDLLIKVPCKSILTHLKHCVYTNAPKKAHVCLSPETKLFVILRLPLCLKNRTNIPVFY